MVKPATSSATAGELDTAMAVAAAAAASADDAAARFGLLGEEEEAWLEEVIDESIDDASDR